MKVIIVAGGKGERLKPLTNNIPKPMINIAGKPILEHTLNLFKKHGFNNFIFALCYLPEVVISYFGDGSKFGVHISYTYEQPDTPLGTAGAASLARDLIDDAVIITYADILRDLNISAMVNLHKNKKAFATINVYKHYGNPKSIIQISEDNTVVNFKERPAPEELKGEWVWSNGSFYIFEPEIFDFIPAGQIVDFGKDVFPKLIVEKKKIIAFPTDGYFIDIGTPEKLEKARSTYKPL